MDSDDPSPKFHLYVTAPPSGSLEPADEKLTVAPTIAEYGPFAIATGGCFTGGAGVAGAVIDAVVCTVAVAPSSSVTVSVTVKAPAAT